MKNNAYIIIIANIVFVSQNTTNFAVKTYINYTLCNITDLLAAHALCIVILVLFIFALTTWCLDDKTSDVETLAYKKLIESVKPYWIL